jgi:hypothetical protein
MWKQWTEDGIENVSGQTALPSYLGALTAVKGVGV